MATFLAQDALRPLPAQMPYDKQAVPVPGTKRPGQTAHYVNGMWGPFDPTKYSIQTLPDMFISGLAKGKDRPFLGRRPVISKRPLKFANYFEWETYGQVDVRRRKIGSALVHLFKTGVIGGGELETVGIWSINRPEWQILDIALVSYKKVGVSLYDTLGRDSVVTRRINHAELTIIFATMDHIPSLLKMASKTPRLKLIVSIDALSPEISKVFTEWGQTHNILVKDLSEIEALGQANLIEPIPCVRSDIASICYTSGTTNMPKGVVLTHGQFTSSVVTNLFGLELPDDASVFSYLPLAHIYGRVNEMASYATGAKIGFYSGDPLLLIEDCQILRPSFFPGVPRASRGDLFRKAYQAKLEKFRATGDNTHWFWDKLVFRKISAVLGGRVLLMSSGSAPISRDVADFLNIAFGCYWIFPGYGMTETCAVGSKTWRSDADACSTVGPPQSSNEIKLVDVPAMGYTSEDLPNPRGELYVRGHNCFSRYYKDEKNTKETIDEEGWVHTGDVAEIDSSGRLKIIDRVKNIMKLAQGEYVALEKIENTYSTCPVVAQIYIHGDSLQSFLVGVIVPDPVQLAGITSTVYGKKVAPEDVATLAAACKDPRVNQHILGMLSQEGKKAALKGFENLKRIHVSLDPFSTEDNTMTPTMKIRRKDAYKKFKTELDALYALGDTKL
ncbi:Long chain acyl-CoA synthetase 7, peroxisomal [Mycena venus]|uniref:Long chain acyl-CoA synthetase 7, peroxisomal n=1 Tax=Mycena venus TaxID=2733690 RepID=A0A8H6Y3S9_9AGAR|nr:Long chain acyl-CoA synthetase 7, peroxisomal [Mycena venus]